MGFKLSFFLEKPKPAKPRPSNANEVGYGTTETLSTRAKEFLGMVLTSVRDYHWFPCSCVGTHMQTRYAFPRLSVGTRVDEVRTIPERPLRLFTNNE